MYFKDLSIGKTSLRDESPSKTKNSVSVKINKYTV
jgi:hypothetical protein